MNDTNNTDAIATRHAAVDYARANPGAILCKYADPTEGAREGLTIDEAEQILREDPSLIYVVSGKTLAVATDTTSASTRSPVSLNDYEAHLSWLLDRTDLTDDERCAGLRSAERSIGEVAWSGTHTSWARELRIRYCAEIDRLESAGADWCAGLESGIARGKLSLGRARV